MTKESERLVAYGFVKEGISSSNPTIDVDGTQITIVGKTPEDKLNFIRKKREEYKKEGKSADFENALQETADQEWLEQSRDQMVLTDYPTSISRYQITMESWHQSIETYYYWCLNVLGDIGYPQVEKITDLFTAAEHSSFYGAGAQKLGLAQDKVGQYLATIGKMVKDLFQLVRELRIIDERLELYRGAIGETKEGKKIEPQKGPEVALKGLWVDMVDGMVGGQRTGGNIFTLATQLQFTALPDLFFSIHPRNKDEVDKVVDTQAKEFNEQVRNVLRRKLAQYVAWKFASYDELKTRRKFNVDYLRQHYQVIRMYMNWVKPYIRHIERLSGEQDLLKNPRLIAAFESSLVEIEILAKTKPAEAKDTYSCLLMTFEYHTKPQMQYPGDSGYHRGPIHVGSTRITWRSYSWTTKEIQNYLDLRNRQDMELLTSIDSSLKSAMDALGKDLYDYLKEAGEQYEEPKKEEEKKQKIDILEPFTAVYKGVKETLGAIMPELPKAKSEKESKNKGDAQFKCWLLYNLFKKSHGLLAW